jgi:hypothetical protein
MLAVLPLVGRSIHSRQHILVLRFLEKLTKKSQALRFSLNRLRADQMPPIGAAAAAPANILQPIDPSDDAAMLEPPAPKRRKIARSLGAEEAERVDSALIEVMSDNMPRTNIRDLTNEVAKEMKKTEVDGDVPMPSKDEVKHQLLRRLRKEDTFLGEYTPK